MAKYSEELVEKVVFLLEEEFYTTTQICKALGFSRQAFYSWMDSKPEFRKEIEDATHRRDEALMTMVHVSLKKKLEGYMTVEEKDVYVPDVNNPGELVFKSKVITKKECAPDLRTIKMLLERNDKKSLSRPPVKKEVEHVSEDSRVVLEEVIGDGVNTEMPRPHTDRIEASKIDAILSDGLICSKRKSAGDVTASLVSKLAKERRCTKSKRVATRNIKKHVRFVKF